VFRICIYHVSLIKLKALLDTRAKLNAVMGPDEQITVNDMFIKAASLAMKTVPSVNSSWMESVVRTYKRCDINVMIGAGDSAQAPVLLDVGSKGLKGISNEMKTAMNNLSAGSASSSAPYAAGTFSMVNLGMYGVTSAAPIVTSPQAAVLALGAIEERVLPNNDPESEVIYRLAPVVTATCSFDHRVVDGAVGAQWLDAFKKLLENPMTMLL
jgi:pyruvate dehydrogenase E2 component (dihydrolipoamide acetyltransferase)